jgi:hypothetical protein
MARISPPGHIAAAASVGDSFMSTDSFPLVSLPFSNRQFAVNEQSPDPRLARLRQVAADLRGNDLFECFVRQFVVIFHNTPSAQWDEEIGDLKNLAKAILEVRAEDNGHKLEEWNLSEISAAMVVEAITLMEQNPTAAGHA